MLNLRYPVSLSDCMAAEALVMMHYGSESNARAHNALPPPSELRLLAGLPDKPQDPAVPIKFNKPVVPAKKAKLSVPAKKAKWSVPAKKAKLSVPAKKAKSSVEEHVEKLTPVELVEPSEADKQVELLATLRLVKRPATLENVEPSIAVKKLKPLTTVELVKPSATVDHVEPSLAVKEVQHSAAVDRTEISVSVSVEEVHPSGSVEHVEPPVTVKQVQPQSPVDQEPIPVEELKPEVPAKRAKTAGAVALEVTSVVAGPARMPQQVQQRQKRERVQKRRWSASSSSDEEAADVEGDVPIGTGKTVIPKDKYEKCRLKNYRFATRSFLDALFPKSILATHSVTGKPSPAFAHLPAKKRLNPMIVKDITIEVSKRYGMPHSLVRAVITTKCADEAKISKNLRLKKEAGATRQKRGRRPNKERQGGSSEEKEI